MTRTGRPTCVDFFGMSRRAALSRMGKAVEDITRFTDLPRVACTPVCDFRGSFVFGTIMKWSPSDAPGDSSGTHMGTDDPISVDMAQTFLRLLLAELEDAVLLTWEHEPLFDFALRYATVQETRQLLVHIERGVELKCVFERVARGGFRARLCHVAASVAGIARQRPLRSTSELLAAIERRDEGAANEFRLRLEAGELPWPWDVAYWDREAWAWQWTIDGGALWQTFLETDGQLQLRRLQEVDRWLLDEVVADARPS